MVIPPAFSGQREDELGLARWLGLGCWRAGNLGKCRAFPIVGRKVPTFRDRVISSRSFGWSAFRAGCSSTHLSSGMFLAVRY